LMQSATPRFTKQCNRFIFLYDLLGGIHEYQSDICCHIVKLYHAGGL